MFERHGADFIVARLTPHQPDEGSHCADLTAAAERRHLDADIEILALHPDHAPALSRR
jgi:hypothetical protein